MRWAVELKFKFPDEIVPADILTERPAVKSETATFTVALDCTIGKTSVPAKGVVEEASADILVLAILSCT